jgi:hypothetical protein
VIRGGLTVAAKAAGSHRPGALARHGPSCHRTARASSSRRPRGPQPGEHDIYLYAPPFQTVAQRVADGDSFWTREVAAPDQIDFDLTVAVADFGHGSDAPVVLDYRRSRDHPAVPRLRYSRSPGSRTSWVVMAESFDEFSSQLRLEEAWTGHGRIFPRSGTVCEVWVPEDVGHRQRRCLNPVVTAVVLTRGPVPNVVHCVRNTGFS